jgi:general secretion pathway protein G
MKKIFKRLRSCLLSHGKNDGFTLLELLIVVAIIAIMGGFAVTRLTTVLDSTKVKAVNVDIKTFMMNLERYYIEHNSYPTTAEDLQKLLDAGMLERKKDTLLDPWDNPYQYRYPGQYSDGPEIWSLGADKQEGGEGINADITSWEQ